MMRTLNRGMCFTALVVALFAAIFAQSARTLAAEPFDIKSRPTIGPFLNGKLPQRALVQTGKWAVVEAFPNLEFEDPTCMQPEPRSNRLYITGRQGKIWSFFNDPATSEKHEFLDLTEVTQGWDDCGLMGFAFHPEFNKPDSPNRGYVYVWYHYSPKPVPGPRRPPVDTPGYNRLSRFTVPDAKSADEPRLADRKSELALINQFDHNLWHDGSNPQFGADGFLYLGVSDEGDAYDSFHNSQTIRKKMFGGMLRIDVDCNPERSHAIRRHPRQEEMLPDGFTENSYTANYFIPNDNPFLDPDGAALEEFWAVGLRNPHRLTIDPPTQKLWVGDIGQDRYEEIDIVERGGNYQWVYMEGTHPTVEQGVVKQKPAAADLIGVEKPPVYDYEHGIEGKCIIGGYVYRGREFANELGGRYIFGDNGSGRIWALNYDGKNPASAELLGHALPGTGYSGLSSFGVDREGELYLLKVGRPAKIWKLAHADEAARKASITFAAPERLSWMEAFADIVNLQPIAGCIPYEVNSPLWSDGAQKQRWIAVPDGAKIQFAPTGEWKFPDGTVFIKHFDMVVDETTGAKKRLETRFLVRQAGGGVYGVTYRWRTMRDLPEGELVAAPQTERIAIRTADGGTRMQTWYYPGPPDCLACHNSNAGDVLGVNARQLNRSCNYASDGTTVSENQVRAWNRLGLFDHELTDAEISKLPALANVNDNTASLEHRARSYLDSNCAHCHRPNGTAGYFDARFDTPLAEQGLLNGRLAKPNAEFATVICPGEVSKSMLHERMKTADKLLMPPLARSVPDADALHVINDWIQSLPPTAVP
jgi:uncharacterized repeat protein (TIGR03806 family)